MSEQSQTYTVVLVRSNEPRTWENLRAEHIAHPLAMRTLTNLLSEAIENAEKYSQPTSAPYGVITKRVHDTIFIYGTRGSGKTTFIVDYLQILHGASKGQSVVTNKKTEEFSNEKLKNIYNKIELLGIIDPTLLTQPQNTILYLIAIIRDKVAKQLEQANTHYQSHNICDNQQHNKLYQQWHQSLKNLAKSISGSNTDKDNKINMNFKSHNEIIETGLRQILDSHNLESNLHCFISISLKILNKKSFLIIMDDIDTHFDTGWHVLETLRKFCTTPQLITILLGDIELYTMRVRDEKLKDLGETLLKDEERKSTSPHQDTPKYDKMVESLQSQYLIKILPPQRRTHLPTLNQALKSQAIKYTINTKFNTDTDTDIHLDKEIKNLLKKSVGITTNQTIQSCTDLILSQPLRTILSILPETNKTQDPPSTKNLTNSLTDALIESNINITNLQQNTYESTIQEYINFLTTNKLWPLGTTLHPHHPKESLALSSIVLASKINPLVSKSTGLALDFMLRIVAAKENEDTSQRHDTHYPQWGNIAVTPSPKENLSGKIIAWRSSFPTPKKYAIQGAFQIRGKSSQTWKEKTKAILIEIKNTKTDIQTTPAYIPSILNNEDQTIHNVCHQTLKGRLEEKHWQYLFELPIVKIKNTTTETHISILPIIEIISLILNPNTPTISKKNPYTDILHPFNNSKTIPIKTTTNNTKKEETDDDDYNDNNDNNDDESNSTKPFDEALIIWVNTIKNEPNNADQELLTKIWLRFEDALSNQSQSTKIYNSHDLKEITPGLGHLLHLQCIAFFNAILIEEAEVTLPSRNHWLRDDNINQSERVFIENYLQIPNNEQKNLKLLNIVASCPLWYAYLKPSNDTQSATKIIENITASTIESTTKTISELTVKLKTTTTTTTIHNLYHILNLVTPAGYNSKQQKQ